VELYLQAPIRIDGFLLSGSHVPLSCVTRFFFFLENPVKFEFALSERWLYPVNEEDMVLMKEI
jgi:hypothetical protein